MHNTDNTPMIDRETYRKIKKMSREEIQAFLMRYADTLLEDKDECTIDLPTLEAELRTVKGIGEKRLDIIMSIIEKYLGV